MIDINQDMRSKLAVAKKIDLGRPTKYRPEMCDQLPEIYRYGADIGEACVQLGISRRTYYNWKEAHPEFKRATDWGEQLSLAWWTRLGAKMATGEVEGSAAVWIFNMKNRAGWRDKVEFDRTRSIEVVVDQNDLDV